MPPHDSGPRWVATPFLHRTFIDYPSPVSLAHYPDGGGLYLAVKPGGSKNWLYRFRTRWMGLGAFPTFSLSEARERAAAARQSCSSVLSREMFRWLKSAKARKQPINAKSRLDSVALNR